MVGKNSCDFILKKQGKVIAKQKTQDLRQMLSAIDAVIAKEQGN